MPVLKNARHERFAVALAAGKAQGAAYAEAGYKPDDGAASRLSGNVKIQERVAELLRGFAMTKLEWLQSFARIAVKAEKKGDFQAAKGALREIGLAMPGWYAPEELGGKVEVIVRRSWDSSEDKSAGANPGKSE